MFAFRLGQLMAGMIVAAAPALSAAQQREPQYAFYATERQRWMYSGERASTAPWSQLQRPIGLLDTTSRHVLVRNGLMDFQIWGMRQNGAEFRPVETALDQRQAVESTEDLFDRYVLSLRGADRAARRGNVRETVVNASGSFELSGERESRIVGDTIIRSRRLAIIRDVARVTLTSGFRMAEPFLPALRYTQQRLTGRIVTRRVYDAEFGTSVRIDDSTSLSGVEARTVPELKPIHDNVRFERVRTVEYVHRSVVLTRAEPSGGPSGTKSTAISATPDSTLLDRTIAPLLAVGDTGAALRAITVSSGLFLSRRSYQLYRLALADVQFSMRFGVDPGKAYESLIFHTGPLGVGTTEDVIRWRSDDARRLMLSEWDRAVDPRLRAISLALRYWDNPDVWADTLIQFEQRGLTQLRSFSKLARGISQIDGGAPELAFPDIDADWHEWFDWLRGATTRTLAIRDSVRTTHNLPKGGTDSTDRYRLQKNLDAVRSLYHKQRQTKRNYQSAFERLRATAANDSSRATYDALIEMTRQIAVFDSVRMSRAATSPQKSGAALLQPFRPSVRH